MKNIYKAIAILPFALFATSFCGCNDELATEDAQKVSSETVLSSTTGLNMVLNSAYKCLLMGDHGADSQNDACYAGLAGLAMHYDLGGADIMSTTNYGGSPESTYKFLSERTMASGNADRIWANMYKVINQSNQIIDALPNATGEDTEKNAIRGQALAMRGISYFHLIMNYPINLYVM